MDPQNLPPTRDTHAFEYPVRAYDLGPDLRNPFDYQNFGLTPVDVITDAIDPEIFRRYRENFFAFKGTTRLCLCLHQHQHLIPFPPERVPYEVGDEVFSPRVYEPGVVPPVGAMRIRPGTITKATPMRPGDKEFDRQPVWVQWERLDAKEGWVNDGAPQPAVAAQFTLYRQEPRLF